MPVPPVPQPRQPQRPSSCRRRRCPSSARPATHTRANTRRQEQKSSRRQRIKRLTKATAAAALQHAWTPTAQLAGGRWRWSGGGDGKDRAALAARAMAMICLYDRAALFGPRRCPLEVEKPSRPPATPTSSERGPQDPGTPSAAVSPNARIFLFSARIIGSSRTESRAKTSRLRQGQEHETCQSLGGPGANKSAINIFAMDGRSWLVGGLLVEVASRRVAGAGPPSRNGRVALITDYGSLVIG